MKFLSISFLLLLANAEAQNLRNDGSKQRRRRLNADVIDDSMAASLPTVNGVLQGAIEDPSEY